MDALSIRPGDPTMAAVSIHPYQTDDRRWRAVETRDHAAAGAFLYGVVTTGIFCRPGCSSRRPRRENVRFFDDMAAAVAAGFRACRRCRPAGDNPDADTELLRHACALIDQAEESPARAALAGALGVSETRLARLFVTRLGVTVAGYWRSRRAERLRAGLARGESVTNALHDAGYGSSSRLYAAGSETLLGMPPARYRAGAPGERIEWAIAPCSLGAVLVASTARGVCAIELGDDERELRACLARRFRHAELAPAPAHERDALAAVVALVEHPSTPATLPLDILGTAFQRRVWNALREIPPGQRLGYGELAARLGLPRGARAVAAAVSANPLAVAVPCHRVVGADGSLRGYRWGIERKRALLAREGAG